MIVLAAEYFSAKVRRAYVSTKVADSLPNAVDRRRSHWRSCLACKRLPKRKHVHEDTVDAILAGRVRVGLGGFLGVFVGAVYAPSLRVAKKEALGGGHK